MAIVAARLVYCWGYAPPQALLSQAHELSRLAGLSRRTLSVHVGSLSCRVKLLICSCLVGGMSERVLLVSGSRVAPSPSTAKIQHTDCHRLWQVMHHSCEGSAIDGVATDATTAARALAGEGVGRSRW